MATEFKNSKYSFLGHYLPLPS